MRKLLAVAVVLPLALVFTKLFVELNAPDRLFNLASSGYERVLNWVFRTHPRPVLTAKTRQPPANAPLVIRPSTEWDDGEVGEIQDSDIVEFAEDESLAPGQ